MTDYPKLMVRGGEEITVGGAAEQRDKEREGFRAVTGARLTSSAPASVPKPDPTPEPAPVADTPVKAKPNVAKKKKK